MRSMGWGNLRDHARGNYVTIDNLWNDPMKAILAMYVLERAEAPEEPDRRRRPRASKSC